MLEFLRKSCTRSRTNFLIKKKACIGGLCTFFLSKTFQFILARSACNSAFHSKKKYKFGALFHIQKITYFWEINTCIVLPSVSKFHNICVEVIWGLVNVTHFYDAVSSFWEPNLFHIKVNIVKNSQTALTAYCKVSRGEFLILVHTQTNPLHPQTGRRAKNHAQRW